MKANKTSAKSNQALNTKKNNLTIVMPIYNRKRYLKHSLSQLKKWPFDINLILIQDGPSVGSTYAELAKLDGVYQGAVELCTILDIPFEIKRRKTHLGCCRNVSLSISEGFQKNEFLYVIEDDILVSAAFPSFCESIRKTRSSCLVNANSFSARPFWSLDHPTGSLIKPWLTRMFRCWGWACSRDIWENSFCIKKYESSNILSSAFLESLPNYYINNWKTVIANLNSDQLDSWASRFQLSLWENRLMPISPGVNLSSHIGFDGSHYNRKWSHHNYLPFYEPDKYIEPSFDDDIHFQHEREIDELEYIFCANCKSPKYNFKRRYMADLENPDFVLPCIANT